MLINYLKYIITILFIIKDLSKQIVYNIYSKKKKKAEILYSFTG